MHITIPIRQALNKCIHGPTESKFLDKSKNIEISLDYSGYLLSSPKVKNESHSKFDKKFKTH